MARFRYYVTQRPAAPGAFPNPPSNRAVETFNFDRPTFIKEIGRAAWGYVEYERPISDVSAALYELTPGQKEA